MRGLEGKASLRVRRPRDRLMRILQIFFVHEPSCIFTRTQVTMQGKLVTCSFVKFLDQLAKSENDILSNIHRLTTMICR